MTLYSSVANDTNEHFENILLSVHVPVPDHFYRFDRVTHSLAFDLLTYLWISSLICWGE